MAVQENSMIRAIEKLDSLDFSTDFHLQLDWIPLSLPKSFSQIIMNFHMNKSECTLAELLCMLNTAQKAIQGIKEMEVALVASSSGTMKKGNKKRKGKTSVVKPKVGVAKNKNKATVRED